MIFYIFFDLLDFHNLNMIDLIDFSVLNNDLNYCIPNKLLLQSYSIKKEKDSFLRSVI